MVANIIRVLMANKAMDWAGQPVLVHLASVASGHISCWAQACLLHRKDVLPSPVLPADESPAHKEFPVSGRIFTVDILIFTVDILSP